MITKQMLIAGFGGQGILYLGKILAACGMQEGKNVSWLPSYGPEMRGGTANCGVCISDEAIACPLVETPDYLIAMNQQSYDKYHNKMADNGLVFVDSSIVKIKFKHKMIITIPATDLAKKNELKGLANVILLGYFVKKTGILNSD
ncbi:MAG: 2-oxoacid:acceptor oxidoreductase family protein, partial [Oscillospiraceae bacterium]